MIQNLENNIARLNSQKIAKLSLHLLLSYFTLLFKRIQSKLVKELTNQELSRADTLLENVRNGHLWWTYTQTIVGGSIIESINTDFPKDVTYCMGDASR